MGRLSIAIALIASVAIATAACGGAEPGPPAAATAELPAPRPKPRNAHAIALSIASGKVSVLVHADRVQGHPLAARALALDAWRPYLEGTGVDLQKDIQRAFVTTPSAKHGHEAVAVFEHSMDAMKVRSVVEMLIARSDPPGGWVPDVGVLAARVTLRGRTRLVALPEPNVIVVLPESHAKDAPRFVGTGGLPEPDGPAAALAMALEPAETLKAPRVPPVPDTLRSLGATVTLGADGGADVDVEGFSTTTAQAAEDAQALTKSVDQATSVGISIVRIRFFQPVLFRSEGDRVKSHVHLTPQELERLLSLASALSP